MKKSVIDLLKETSAKYPDNIAVSSDSEELTYCELYKKVKAIGSEILKFQTRNKPILIYSDKNIHALAAMLGVAASDNLYVPMDVHMPEERLKSIINTVAPIGVITVHGTELPPCIQEIEHILYADDDFETDENALNKAYEKMIDTDPAYIIFTSGSTGVPKGAVATHRNVLSYIEWAAKQFGYNENAVTGTQAPFYFSLSVTEIYSCLATGATYVIVPRSLFSQPVKLLEYLSEKKVTIIDWVPSAFGIITSLKALDYVTVPTLKYIAFGGESLPVKVLNDWKKHYPNACLIQAYGPTEATDISALYFIERDFTEAESIPIGYACDNLNLFLLNENNERAEINEVGEICVRGSYLSPGYYNNPEKTAECFVQNPLNKAYPELVYRTGDLAKINELGEIVFIGRKDYQIKHMGNRIELGEIESAADRIPELNAVCCAYDSERKKIVLAYEGNISKKDVKAKLHEYLPDYMVPEVVFSVKVLPKNANGKIDRKYLANNYNSMRKESRKGETIEKKCD